MFRRPRLSAVGVPRGGFSLPSDDIEGWLKTVRTGTPIDLKKGNLSPFGTTETGTGANPSRISAGTQGNDTAGGKRKMSDMPAVRRIDRASMAIVHEGVAKGHQTKQDILNELVTDMHAASSRAPRESQLATWTRYHKMWFGDESEPWPLDEQKIIRVSALFKYGGYKSFKNYLSRAKEFHIMSGHDWTDRLDVVSKKCAQSVLRGLAGPTRSESFDLPP